MNRAGHDESSPRQGRVLIQSQARLLLNHHVQSQYPEEACGGLLGRAGDGAILTVSEAAPQANSQVVERERRYLVGPEDVLRLERRAEANGLQVLGFYHSHPDAAARPSAFDLEHAWPWYIYLIVAVNGGQAGELSAWRLAEDRRSFNPCIIDTGLSHNSEGESR